MKTGRKTPRMIWNKGNLIRKGSQGACHCPLVPATKANTLSTAPATPAIIFWAFS
jgi:hypothetical protein